MTTKAVTLREVTKRYGSDTAVDSIDLSISSGEFVALLGPSGCGKTTTLRMIAGLEVASEGEIEINGRRVNDIPAHRRNIGMVFQNHALFPHRTSFQNVAYGLKTRGVSDAEISRRVREALEIVRLPTMERRYPSELSGGQQQRIAIARAIVIRPDLLLLDEPLSALDANLREEMREELKRIQTTLGITTIFVTHDQSEALSLADEVVLMNKGRIEQRGSPQELYSRPRTEFAARFFGHVNQIEGMVVGHESGASLVRIGQEEPIRMTGYVTRPGPIKLLLRAERARVIECVSGDRRSGKLTGTVRATEYLGMLVKYTVETETSQIQVLQAIDGAVLPVGHQIAVSVPSDAWIVL
ncbi:putative spermidine/putrescine transport system ATP-binding protein/spermidine/putrescine transport system ATP-binding protein [Burkholderia sp. D7]|nr:putative spermidine/putrescine transport system ATP-binding protein/spermidine/putrescine transport system ATP-binding protein [Burkholderia sp. D7]